MGMIAMRSNSASPLQTANNLRGLGLGLLGSSATLPEAVLESLVDGLEVGHSSGTAVWRKPGKRRRIERSSRRVRRGRYKEGGEHGQRDFLLLMDHYCNSRSLSPLGLKTPVVAPQLGGRVSTLGTG